MASEFAVEMQDVLKQFVTPEGGILAAVNRVTMQIKDGEFFSLLGPSGCGKTTSLRMIAGFELPTDGKILIHGKEMSQVPAFQRPINTVFQQYALFPHMTVEQNIGFGLEMKGVSKADRSKRVSEALEMVRLPGMEMRRPKQLSGGQQQRIALARALVNKPEVLLLDEPLGALDLKLRKEMQLELKTLQREVGITFIYVTHDQEEALTMADRIAVMDKGKVLQVGTPEEIYETPTTRFVADFIGETNFLQGMLSGTEGNCGIVKLDGSTIIKAGMNEPSLSDDQPVTIAIRPEKINLFAVEGRVRYPDGSSDLASEYKTAVMRDPDINMVEGTITSTNYIGTDTRYVVTFGEGLHLVARVQNYGLRSETVFQNGQRVNIFWDADHSRVLVE